MVGLFLKQVSPEFLLMEPRALFSQTLCIKNCSLAQNGAEGSVAARSSALLGLPAFVSIFRTRCKASCALVAFSQPQFLQLFLQVLQSGAQTVPSCQYPSLGQIICALPVQLVGFGALHGRGRRLQARDCSWGRPGGFVR